MTDGNKCPIDHSNMQWLWEHNKGIQDELREVVEPLSEAVSTYVEADVSQRDAVSHETQNTRVQHEVPFGEPYFLLPPRLFGNLFDVTTEAPVIPQKKSEIKSLFKSYMKRRLDDPADGVLESSAYTWSTTGHENTKVLRDDLENLATNGVTIDADKWERYKEVGREQARAGRYDLDIISWRRAKSVRAMYSTAIFANLVDTHATSTFDHFIAMETSALDVGGKGDGLVPVGYLFMPVGEYGSVFAEKLLRTTTYMVNATGNTVTPLAQTVAAEHQEAILKYTTRGADGRPLDVALTMMTQEGSRSIMEATALLMADKVEGYDDPDLLFEAIIDQGMLEQLTRSMPMGLLGPLAFSGNYFPHLLQNKGNGKLELNPEAIGAIKQAKRDVAAAEIGAWMTYWALPEDKRKDASPPHATSLICPAAMPHGALRRMSQATLTAFKAFNFEQSADGISLGE